MISQRCSRQKLHKRAWKNWQRKRASDTHHESELGQSEQQNQKGKEEREGSREQLFSLVVKVTVKLS